MLTITLPESLSQKVYSATHVLTQEARIAGDNKVPMLDLMEQAGAAALKHIVNHYGGLNSLLVVCGKGNNGGDGFVVARLAQEQGLTVCVYLTCPTKELSGDALINYQRLLKTPVSLYQYQQISLESLFSQYQFELIVDGIFGIGFRGDLPDSIKDIVTRINDQEQSKLVSLDVPSGLNASTGHVASTAIKADSTISFIVCKQGLLTGMAANYIGQLFVDDLSLGADFQTKVASDCFLQLPDNLPRKPQRRATAHKGDIGLLLALGGNEGMPGAIRLATEAALRGGAALVSVCCHQNARAIVASGRPELMLPLIDDKLILPSAPVDKANVLLLGPGLGLDNWANCLFNQCIDLDKSMVIDADGLTLLSQNPNYQNNRVLTPHPKEAATLLGCSINDILANRFWAIEKIVEKYGGICVLKGAGSLICDGKNTWINSTGNSGMASGGMGDVLSGIIAAFLLQMDSAIDAVRLAVYIHGKAADDIAQRQGKIGMLASDIIAELPRLIN